MQRDTLGFYLEVARTVQKLKQVGRNALIEAEGDDSLTAMLWRLQKLLGESTNDPNVAGLRPFSRLRLFQEGLLRFYQELVEGLGDNEPAAQAMTLGRLRHRQLQDLIEGFEQVFRAEVESRVVFISPDRAGLLELGSLGFCGVPPICRGMVYSAKNLEGLPC